MTATFEIPRDWLVDPVTKAPLGFDGNLAHGPSGTYRFDARGGYWDFLPAELRHLFGENWAAWDQLQRNGVVSYQNDPAHNLGVGDRPDFREFARFCNLHGKVLDVGCGPQKAPTHLADVRARGVFFVGLDPLLGEQPRDFAFILGVGEYLPFRAGVFDQVLFVTSLDHFLDPLPPLLEAKRILADKGEICVWIGDKDKNAPRPSSSPEWYRDLEVPAGAEDVFHFRRFTAAEFEEIAANAGLKTAERQVGQVDAWRRNYFYRLRAA